MNYFFPRLLLRLCIVTAIFVVFLIICQRLLERDEQVDAYVLDQPSTTQVTIEDVMAADIPKLVRERVSFPTFSYRDAFPEAKDEPEYIIDSFQSPAMLENPDTMPAHWRRYFPDDLPPVEERLPRNPAVVLGPDGIGEYGGVWRRSSTAAGDLTTKIGYESFIRFDPKGRIQPGLAYKWEISEDKRVYTFYLRKGHKWSDGEPFTTEDILWVTNHLIGSPRWAAIPDWMQPTDGNTSLYPDDARDWQAVAVRILEQADRDVPTPGGQLLALGGEELRNTLEKLSVSQSEDDVHTLIPQLERVIFHPDFIDEQAWAEVDLDTELHDLQQKGVSHLDEKGLERLELLLRRNGFFRQWKSENRTDIQNSDRRLLSMWLFRAAYPDLIQPATQTRVKIEAVPDETGDTSHILRFTFRKPNSIFLERTGTFMFYRGLFNVPKHKDRLMQVIGSDRLERTDILDWTGLADILQSAGPDAPVAAATWAQLDSDAKTLLSGNAATLSESQKDRVIEALNTVLEQPEFLQPGDWSRLDLESELASLREMPYPDVHTSWDLRIRCRELLVRENLLARVEMDGLNSLGDSERYTLFQSILRESLWNGTKVGPVARNRTEGLNVTAQNHPLKYTSWVVRGQRHLSFDPEFNPNPPTLFAWRNITKGEERTQVAVRNPYYYRVDPEGNQLPYLDAVETEVEANKQVRMLKLRSGNVDFQVRQIDFEDFTVLKQNEKIGNYKIRIWPQDFCGQVTFAPIQANEDDAFRELNNDPRFRHALSLALNRQQMIDVVFNGIGEPAQAAVPKGSPYYNETHWNAYTAFDPEEASRLLDELGLDKRAADGTRLLPDGRPFVMSVNAVDADPLPLVQMACQFWQNIGINAQMKVMAHGTLLRLANLGKVDVIVRKEGGNYFGPLAPGIFAPSHPAENRHWGRWVTNLQGAGGSGIWVPPPRVYRANELWQDFLAATTDEAKFEAWKRVSDQAAHQLNEIGITSSPGKLIYVRNGFMNVPKIALAGWIAHEPGNSCPEIFWKTRESRL